MLTRSNRAGAVKSRDLTGDVGTVLLGAVTSFFYEEFDLSDIQTYPLTSRRSKAHASDFAHPAPSAGGIGAFIDSLPSILAAADFKAVVRAILEAKQTHGGIL